MEREVGEGRGRRGGGEKMKKISLIVTMMSLCLVISCGNTPEASDVSAGNNSLLTLLSKAEEAFYGFADLVTSSMGFTIEKGKTTKKDVGDHFRGLAEKIGETLNNLEKILEEKSSEENLSKPMKKAEQTLKGLKEHVEALGKIDGGQVGETTENAGTSESTEIKRVHTALQGIVDIAKQAGGIKSLEKDSSTLTAVASIGGTSPENGAKVLTTGNVGGSDVGDKATLIVSSVNGDAILESIVTSNADDAGTGVSGVGGTTSALAFAKGHNTHGSIASNQAKASAVAGGIALRSLIKSGKLASHSGNDGKSVQSAGITAVNKLLVAVEDIIKKTVKNVLKEAKEKIDKARESKAIVQR